MSLTLKYRADSSVPVEIEGVVPDRLREQSLAQIERLTIQHGNRKVALAELFAVSGDPSDERVDLEGDLAGVHFIGYAMKSGALHVHGNAGRHVGGEMSGGRIKVDGNAGDFAGCEMHGGVIDIAGDAGHRIGAAYPGSKKGMTDGTILIGGNLGSEAGASMRRGTLVVRGSCGDGIGFNMIAGSILVFRSCGTRPGAGMRRGTIGLFGDAAVNLLPTFRPAGRFRPLFLQLLFRELARLGFEVDLGLIAGDLCLAHGDLVALGKGEVWMRTNVPRAAQTET
jgi:formylmethanofuran dehydrogenase subunit C